MYPEIQPYQSEWLKVSPLHELYVEQVGNPKGVPVVVLHGGPGAGCSANQRRYFDPAFYHVILFDQRGAGRSKPSAETRDNTLVDIIADMEIIRQYLGIEQWLVFGGSWGSTVALTYGVNHPSRCLGFILRGIFLMRPFEVQWFMNQVRYFFPEQWYAMIATFANLSQTPIQNPDRLEFQEILQLMQRVLDTGNQSTIEAMFAAFSGFEEKIMTLHPSKNLPAPGNIMANIGRIQHHYFAHNMAETEGLLAKIERIKHLSCIIVQGRYDVVCPPISAYDLHQRWPKSTLNMVVGGHSGSDSTIAQALVQATDTFKTEIGASKVTRP